MALSSLTYYEHVSRYLPSPPSTLYVFNKHYFVHIVYIINKYIYKNKNLRESNFHDVRTDCIWHEVGPTEDMVNQSESQGKVVGVSFPPLDSS